MKANSSKQLYKVYSRNLYLQPTRCGYGNGTATDYEYNTFGMLTRINTGNKVFQEEPGQPTLPDIPIIGLLSVNDPPAIYGEDNFDIDSTIQNFHYQYVYGANGLAAVCVRRNGVDSLYYVHPDRIGSYTHITDSLKRVVRALHFDPWGNAKADTNWMVFDTTTLADSTLYFRVERGFTGHEHYAELGIMYFL